MVASKAIDEVIGLQAAYIALMKSLWRQESIPACSTVRRTCLAMDELDAKIREAVPIVADVSSMSRING